MKSVRLLAFAPLLLTSACAFETARNRVADGTLVETQVSADQLAACIAQSAGTTASPAVDGAFAVDVPAQAGPMRLTVTRDKVQTIVVAPTDGPVPESVSKTVIDCTLKLTPPSK